MKRSSSIYFFYSISIKLLYSPYADKENLIVSLISSSVYPHAFKTYEEARDEVIKIIEKEKITCLVLGLPKNMDNSMGFASERSLNFKKLLEEKCSLPVNLVDERLSTVEAESILIENNYSRAKRKNVIDELSACIILDTYLRKVG